MEELLEFKKNIISWYPINEKDKVLQIGKDEKIFNELKTKTNNVILTEDIDNLEIKNEFDYITLIGILDDATESKILNILEKSKKMLNKNGKILIAMENKFAMKYWTGQKADDTSNPFETILNSKFISLYRIKNILNSLKLKYKFYYPLPDYKYTNVIYTDEYLPTKDSISARDLTFCGDNELLVFSEREAFKALLEEAKEMFPIFANSYFIEVSDNDKFEEIKYVSYGITRNAKYRIKTIMGKNIVYKSANNAEAKQHIYDIARNIDILKKCKINCLDSFENDRIVSKFLNNSTAFNDVLLEEYFSRGLDSTIEKIKEFKNNILDKLLNNSQLTQTDIFEKYNIDIPKELKSKMHFTQNGIIDLIFQNCLQKGNDIYVYDQEWFEENVPIEFILYRAVFYLTDLKEIIDINEIYTALKINSFIKYFEELESKIQDDILDKKIWDMHINSIKTFSGSKTFVENYENKISALKKHEAQLEDVIEKYKNSIEELTKSVKEKDTQLENYANELRAIANSLSWKITKPIRKISGAIKRKK